ncbi:malonyl-ACP O-methyltransferase BioC [Photobacterium atrarenae]|uniref:Malonyl-[acyl-carrier protein] O-methyltransferase n=1 Tax=Photobacterium atrarenae TaxID=865757 RepID=A0ABY5GHP1_9GAMM|nr:malonyl-ACP O-methyltransferase BioC [Photobacterium atrarenae]UTV28774.1 malonyl-ACP O-methyltransferase BioC [Photobacterium atrarenae]
MANEMNAVTQTSTPVQIGAPPQPHDKRAIAEAFGRAADHYDQAAAFQRLVGHRLLEQLPALCQAGSRALDLGCGTGYFTEQLLCRGYQVCAADLSVQMLVKAGQRCGERATYLEADAEALPLDDNQFDLAFSSMALQWCDDLATPLKELKRVVRPGGLIAFTTLVDGSLHELAAAWEEVDSRQHVNRFLSQKEINLALAQVGGSADLLDFSPITMHYQTAVELMKDLKGIGATHLHQARKSGLAGRQTIRAVERAYDAFRDSRGQLPATYQVCFGVITND